MKIEEWLPIANKELEKAGIGTARLDSLILLEATIHKDRAWILAHPEHRISNTHKKSLNKKLERRANHEPISYIRGFCEFYGRKFKVNKRVLEPRPESETMIEILKKLSLPLRPKIADVGCGSGALGITAKLEIHDAVVDLYDIDSGALAVAKHNVHLHELRLEVHKRDLLNRPVRRYDLVLANLPYVPDTWTINKAAKAEPKLAIFGGPDGLDLYRRLFKQLDSLDHKPAYVLTEALPPQHSGLAKIATAAGYKKIRGKDFIQVFKTD